MKRRLFFLMVFVIVALTSCNESDELQGIIIDGANLESVSFNISSDDVLTRGGSPINRYIMEVWSASGDTVVNCFGENLDTYRLVQSEGSFTMMLDKSLEYTILFWADNKQLNTIAAYNVDDLKNVSLNSGAAMTEHAYFANVKGKVDEMNSVSLNRAVAKINYVQAGDYIDKVDKALTVTYGETYSFSCATGDVTSIDSEVVRVFKANVVLTDSASLATDYTFASAVAGENTLMNLTVNIDGENDSKTISNISLNANKVTNITGQYSSYAQFTTFTISLVDEWDTPSNDHVVSDSTSTDNASISVPISLQSLDSSYTFTVFDRNAGINVPKDGAALNYTNDSLHADYSNSLFKGDYYTWDEAMTGKNSDGTDICAIGWRLPTKDEMEVIAGAMQFSDDRAYIADANGNRCYFPLSSHSYNGYYWSSTEGYDRAWALSVYSSRSSVSNNYRKWDGLSVRCVR